jgi:peptidoglycan/LPS O-acetylase OafA/YrhL
VRPGRRCGRSSAPGARSCRIGTGSGINRRVGSTLATRPADRPTDGAATAPVAQATGSALGHRPGLDGLRGLAVAAVLAYHGGFSWAKGGFLGVSTFFTLSGFLITTLALDERRRSGGVDLRAFWRRRVRRLLPASLAAIALALVVAAAVGDHTQRTNMPGDVIGALADVANWRFLLADQSYGDLFANPSPLLHFWSLAIEEQFYMVFPLLLAGVWAIGRRAAPVGRRGDATRADHRNLAIVLGSMAVASLGTTLFAGWDHEHVYMGTITRAFEVLAGCLLAVAVHRLCARGWLDRQGGAQRGLAAGGAITLALAVASWALIAQTDDVLYRGGLAVYALASTVTVLAACLARGPLRRALGVRPLRHLGQISYGVYLYHWPIFLWLRQGTDLGPWPRFVIGVVLAVALAEVSARLLEMPIRSSGRLLGRRAWVLVPPALASLVAVALVVRSEEPAPVIDFAAAEASLAAPAAAPASSPDPVVTLPDAPPSARVAFFGDSTALMTGDGFADWLAASGRGQVVPGDPVMGCSLVGGETLRVGSTVSPVPPACADWPTEWAQAIAAGQPTTAVVQLGAWDIQDRRIGDDPTWRAPGDPVFDDLLRARLLEAVDVLSSDGATVVWLESPTAASGRGQRRADAAYDEIAPRIQRINELVRELPARRPGVVRVVDLAGWFEGTGEGYELRPDGMHFSRQTAAAVADRFLGAAILGPDWWNRPEPAPTDLIATTGW